MDSKEIQILVEKFIENSASPAEEAELMNWYRSANEQELIWLSGHADERERTRLDMLAAINREIGHAPVRRIGWRWMAAAASVLLFLSIGGYWAWHKEPAQNTLAVKQDIAPGRNQATLTLANGQKIVLTKGLNGKLATQGNTLISVNAGHAIAYTTGKKEAHTEPEVVYNTLSTVRGQESPYPLVLADGTKVWLNAASSITFPTAFNGKARTVKITGEAYFEVVHNTASPFRVEVGGQTIEDLGTAFNINAYADEPTINTTLISGSIKVFNDGQSAFVRPGQVAVVKVNSAQIKVKDIDVENATAWKNGYFLFDHEGLESIMRKISRWYDVDVEYAPGAAGSAGFLGSMTRYANVSQVLSALESAGHVKFKVSGRKIIVLAK